MFCFREEKEKRGKLASGLLQFSHALAFDTKNSTVLFIMHSPFIK